ncbi:lasso peptide isopeptide bond-forming cyclase [Streptomyces sp. P1-3]|uniref:lasso peptide isopeptide bond-forming cyclase n=1 Tax=Streptomyces sp. P1-3 TaxID=3421658 RepID=UPI003D36EA19
MTTGFLVLPDLPEASLLPVQAPCAVSHRSGRPWIVGSWPSDELVQADAGPVRVAVIGFCRVTAARLTELTRQVRTIADADVLARALPGSFHLVLWAHGRLRIQGTLTGLRQVFHTRLDGLPVAGDRADLLAGLTAASVDEQALAARVACGGALPPPLSERSMWTGVSAVPPDHSLIIDGDRTHEARRWDPPAPSQPLAPGAAGVRDALLSAMTGARTSGGRLSTDLSGGMDSTALCFLASRDDPALLTFRWEEAEAGNDDAFYARHAAQALDRAQHLVVPQSRLPEIFADPAARSDAEQPYLFTRTLARMRRTAEILAEHGSRRHLAGHGGDELFTGFPGYLHRLMRRRPLTAIRHLRGHRALRRWPLAATLAQLLAADTAAAWWRAQADRLTTPPSRGRIPPVGWGVLPVHAQPWVTGKALDATRAALRGAAGEHGPLAEDRGQHQTLMALRTTAPAYRQLARIFAAHGVRLHQPYLDDHVVEAALSVRLHERATPWRYKPLLAESMTGLVPDLILSRTTKGDFSQDLRVGRRRNLPALLDMFADSAIAELGLIDRDVLRTRLLAPQADLTRDIALEQLLGCETWLRAARSIRIPWEN